MLYSLRLVLRPFRESDLEAFVAYRSDPEVARYQSWDTPYTAAQAAAFFEDLKCAQAGSPGVWYQLAVERRDAPGLIGDCAYQVQTDDPRQAQIGFTFARAHQKQGYASEAVSRLLAYLFDELHLHRVCATCDEENPASFHLMERVGMRREAHWIENIWFKGKWGSEFTYAILDREWREQARVP